MGCPLSTSSHAEGERNQASTPRTSRRTSADPMAKRQPTIRRSDWHNRVSESRLSAHRSRSSSSGRFSGDRFSGASFFGHHRKSSNSRVSATGELGASDPLGLGTETSVIAPPTQWLTVTGERGAGKSTLARKLKFDHDGIDIPEALRFMREVHKHALTVLKQVLVTVPPFSTDELVLAHERVQKLKRRALITSEVAADLGTLFNQREVRLALATLPDPQARKAARHFASRIDVLASKDYVPEAHDLLHLVVPTVDQHTTRIMCFPAGQLSVLESSKELRSSAFHGRKSDMFGSGLRGIVFVASALSFSTNNTPSGQNASGGATIRPHPELVQQWTGVCAIAATRKLPCMLVLSKCDLLYEADLPAGMSAEDAAASLRSQYFAASACNQSESGMEDATTRGGLVCAANSVTTSLVGEASAPRGCDEENKLSDMLVRVAFPDLSPDDKAVGLGDAIYISLAFFCPAGCSMLSQRGALPVSKWKTGVLGVQDYVWLNELPQPLPNPRLADEDTAMRLGKSSQNALRSSFWRSLCSLAEQLGSFEPQDFGMLHASPLLTTSGALLIVFRRAFESEPSLGSNKRSLAWSQPARVANRIASVAQAGEFPVSDSIDPSALSYAQNVREMIATTAPRDLTPHIWLDKLQDACSSAADADSLRAGTYVVAFITQSTRTGLRILLPSKGCASLPPRVKISEQPISAADWSKICEVETSLRSKTASSLLPGNWADAKNWMGPEMGSERQFDTLQKFFYGVTALRQQLEMKCSAMRDELRSSGVDAAEKSIASLGELYQKEIILADLKGSAQLLLLCRHYSVDQVPEFPSSLQWHPFPIFEARHYAHFTPAAVQTTLGIGRALVLRGGELNTVVRKPTLRDSDLRSSDLRSSGSSCGSVHGAQTLLSEEGGESKEERFAEAFESELKGAWDTLRWTKRVVLEVCRLPNAGEEEGMCFELKTLHERNKSWSPQQRLKNHQQKHRQVAQSLSDAVAKLRKNVALLEEASMNNAGERKV